MVVSVRPEFINTVLSHFLRHFLLCLLMALLFGALLFVVTCRRDLYLRYTAAEMRFWERLGFRSGRLSVALRHFAESNVYKYILWFLVVAFSLLMVLNAVLYFHFKHRLS
jgi:hypothetical protein